MRLSILVAASVCLVIGCWTANAAEWHQGELKEWDELQEKNAVDAQDTSVLLRREKRNVLWRILRWILRFARRGKPTKNAGRITRHYYKRGGFNTALNDFNKMNPTNVIKYPNGARSGTVGKYTVTLYPKSTSTQGPTIVIHGGNYITKIRYQ